MGGRWVAALGGKALGGDISTTARSFNLKLSGWPPDTLCYPRPHYGLIPRGSKLGRWVGVGWALGGKALGGDLSTTARSMELKLSGWPS